MIGIYAGTITTLVTMSSMKEKKILFESTEQEEYVKKYVEHAKHEASKPVLLRTPFQLN
jgi:hypothetical protein